NRFEGRNGFVKDGKLIKVWNQIIISQAKETP
ncbi:hypothetical protein AAULR_16634, partial [Lacticaseibacillus rhamnosus MTCC 5462]